MNVETAKTEIMTRLFDAKTRIKSCAALCLDENGAELVAELQTTYVELQKVVTAIENAVKEADLI